MLVVVQGSQVRNNKLSKVKKLWLKYGKKKYGTESMLKDAGGSSR